MDDEVETAGLPIEEEINVPTSPFLSFVSSLLPFSSSTPSNIFPSPFTRLREAFAVLDWEVQARSRSYLYPQLARSNLLFYIFFKQAIKKQETKDEEWGIDLLRKPLSFRHPCISTCLGWTGLPRHISQADPPSIISTTSRIEWIFQSRDFSHEYVNLERSQVQ